MTLVGFDFGTTNSLVSLVAGDRAISLLDEDGLPTPSVVSYEGDRTIVGREAKRRLGSAGLGIHGNIVRSPKTLLGRESIVVGGMNRDPVEVVRDVVKHVKNEALESAVRVDLEGLRSAVVTIPVSMTGRRRRGLRDAFAGAEIEIVQFVHEPFAALYGLLRSSEDTANQLREFRRNLILVVDWGGGTLDLTLCRLIDGSLVQVRNHGTEEVGGDEFDQAIRQGVIAAHMNEAGIPPNAGIDEDSRTRLLHQCEDAKIELSERSTFAFYIPGFYERDQADLVYSLDRPTMESMTRPMVDNGIRRIRELLDQAGFAPAQVSLCVATGGMVNMPSIRARLMELFGPAVIRLADDSATLISQGAAWVANDERPLTLAKAVEIRLARGAFMPVVRAGTEMPTRGGEWQSPFHLYCADPTDGKAKFQICTPWHPHANNPASEPRTPLADFTVDVWSKAEPLYERLELDVTIDHDLIMRVSGRSLLQEHHDGVEIHDLEYGLSLVDRDSDRPDDSSTAAPDDRAVESQHDPGDLVARANIASERDKALVPGEVLYKFDKLYFDPMRRPPKVQVEERLFYAPCAICGRSIKDPECQCGSKVSA